MTPTTQAEARVAVKGTNEEPQSSSEKYMASLWSEIIGLDEVALSDKFLEVGGNSLTLNVVLNRIKSERGVWMQPQLFFDDDKSTISELARELDKLLADPSQSEKAAPTAACM